MASGHFSVPTRSLHLPSFSVSRHIVSYPSIALSYHKSKTQLRRSHLVFASIRKLSEAESIPIDKGSGKLDDRIPVGAGVYGVYDSNGDLQFVGTTRCLSLCISKHRHWVPGLCSSVKVGPADTGEPDGTVLKSAWDDWINEHVSKTGKYPPGNLTESDSWISPPRLRLTNPTESQIRKVLTDHKTVVFVHGGTQRMTRGDDPDLEYYASTRLVGVLLRYGVDFVTVDLFDEEGNEGVRTVLKTGFGVEEIPQLFVNGELVGGEKFVWDLIEDGKIHTIF